MTPLQEDAADEALHGPEDATSTAWGKIGFWLALAGLVTCGLTLLPAVAASAYGLVRRSGRRYAWAGLGISAALLFAWVYVAVPMVPMGTHAHVMNRAKFRLAWPRQVFWLRFDAGHLERMRSVKPPVFARYAVLFFAGPPGSYTPEGVIDFAQRNGWQYRGKAKLTARQLRMFEAGQTDPNELPHWSVIGFYFMYSGRPAWQTKDVTVLAFDTGEVLGHGSYVSIAEDGSAVEVRYQDPVLPDGGHEFRLPPGYKGLENEADSVESGAVIWRTNPTLLNPEQE